MSGSSGKVSSVGFDWNADSLEKMLLLLAADVVAGEVLLLMVTVLSYSIAARFDSIRNCQCKVAALCAFNGSFSLPPDHHSQLLLADRGDGPGASSHTTHMTTHRHHGEQALNESS